MDTFDMMQKKMKEMAPEELKKQIESLKGMCNCPGCPSYNSCAKNAKESLYCAMGKSFMCISEEKGCICPTCPVAKTMGLKNKFFCTRGAEKAQRYEHTLWGSTMV
jgi:hypothetical protein